MKCVDLFNQPILVGSYLAYPVCVGRSAGIDVCKVLNLGPKTLKVQGVWMSHGRSEKKSKPSFLNCPERAVVIPESMVPADILELLR